MNKLNLAERINQYGKGRIALDTLSIASGVALAVTARYGINVGDELGTGMILLPAIWRAHYEGRRMYSSSQEKSEIDYFLNATGGFMVSSLETIAFGTSFTKYP